MRGKLAFLLYAVNTSYRKSPQCGSHALLALVVLEGLEPGKGRSTSYEFVSETGLVLLKVIVLVDLLVRIFRFSYNMMLKWIPVSAGWQ